MSRLSLAAFIVLVAATTAWGYRTAAEHEHTHEGESSLTHKAANDDACAKGASSNGHYCATVKVDIGDVPFGRIGDVKSCPVRPWTDKQTADREVSVTVTFDVSFVEPPAVSVSLTKLDVDKSYNIRYAIGVEDVTKTGCVITFKTWCNTNIYSSVVTYTAIGYGFPDP